MSDRDNLESESDQPPAKKAHYDTLSSHHKMPDCSKKSASRPSGTSRNTRSASRPCLQTGSRCTDRQKYCCLSSAEIEGRINRLQQKMRQYNRELRDRVAEISREEGPLDMVLLTVVEMTTQYERPIQVINGMGNGVPNGVPNGMPNGVPNGIPNGMRNGIRNGMQNGVPNGDYPQNLGDEDLAALISGALNRFRDEVNPDEERPRY